MSQEKEIDDSILNVARSWVERQSKLNAFALHAKKALITNDDFLQSEAVHKINPCNVNGRFCAIDGSIACEQLHGLDVVFYRSVGVHFNYVNSKPTEVKYFPKTRPELNVCADSFSSQFEKTRFTSLVRLKSELQCALSCLSSFDLDFLLLDGSIAPLVDDKPSADSTLCSLYTQIIDLYQSLYSQCLQKNCTLVGVIKDSRSSRFYDMVRQSLKQSDSQEAKNIDVSCSDTIFLDHYLQKNERTCAFRHSATTQKNPALKDLGKFASNICAFYIKPVAEDRPIRIEFLQSELSFSKIADTLSSLCALNAHYAYPAILIEADLRVAFDPTEITSAISELQTRIGLSKDGLFQLRRNTRPFR